MIKYILFFIIALGMLCCRSGRSISSNEKKLSTGIIIYHGDYFFLFKIKNRKMSTNNVTWPYLYTNIEHTGYSLNGINFYSISKLFPYFRGIKLNVSSEDVKQELKSLYLVPVQYKMKFGDTIIYKSPISRTLDLNFIYNEVPYFDFKYNVVPIDTGSFYLMRNFTLSPDFNLNIDSMKSLIEKLPPGVFKD